jgi:hypothetical protein
MFIDQQAVTIMVLALAGVVLTLYVMRRRVRLGRRTPKF